MTDGFTTWIDNAVKSSAKVYEPIIDELREKNRELETQIECLEKELKDREWNQFRDASDKQSDCSYYCQSLTEALINPKKIWVLLNSLVFKALFDFMRDPDRGLDEIWEIIDIIRKQVMESNSSMSFVRSKLAITHKEMLEFNKKYLLEWRAGSRDIREYLAKKGGKTLPLSFYID